MVEKKSFFDLHLDLITFEHVEKLTSVIGFSGEFIDKEIVDRAHKFQNIEIFFDKTIKSRKKSEKHEYLVQPF